jgi:hypothetical protein
MAKWETPMLILSDFFKFLITSLTLFTKKDLERK